MSRAEAPGRAAHAASSVERQRQETAAQRQRDDEQRRQQAEAARQKQQQEAALKVVPVAVPQEQACKQDAEELARLRASQDKDAAIRFKSTLACTRLRPQVVRLLESLGVTEEASSRSPEASSVPRRVVIGPAAADQAPAQPSLDEQRQKAEAERQRLDREAALQRVEPAMSPEEACKRDGQKLTRLRTSQAQMRSFASNANSAASGCGRRWCVCGKASLISAALAGAAPHCPH